MAVVDFDLTDFRHMHQPRITVVTPSYNQGAFIEETIGSVLDQGYPNLEYIIIDGGSTDKTISILKKYDRHLTHWVSEPDRGQSHAINKGFAHATGDIYAYLNSDDLYKPGVLQRTADAYKRHPQPHKFFHAFAVEEFARSDSLTVIRPKAHNRIVDWIEYRAYLHQPGTFWSNQAHRQAGGFDESLQLAFDRSFFMELIYRGAFLGVTPDFVGASFRWHPESKSTTAGDSGFAPEFDAISAMFRSRYGALGKLGLKWQSMLSRRRSKVEEQIHSDQCHSFLSLFMASLRYPPIVADRFFWGVVRKRLRRGIHT